MVLQLKAPGRWFSFALWPARGPPRRCCSSPANAGTRSSIRRANWNIEPPAPSLRRLTVAAGESGRPNSALNGPRWGNSPYVYTEEANGADSLFVTRLWDQTKL